MLLFSCSVVSDSFVTPWTEAHQVPLSMGFSRQEYWSGLAFPSPEDLPNSGIESKSPTLQADSLPVEPQGKPKMSAKQGEPNMNQGPHYIFGNEL